MIDWRPILLVVGILLIILALFMVPPLVADLAAGHDDWQVFLASAAITLFTAGSVGGDFGSRWKSTGP